MKVCTKCGLGRDETEYYLEKAKRKDGSIREFRRSHCRACELSRKSKADKRTKVQKREAEELRKYGLTPDVKAAMLAAQKHCCGICGTKNPGGRYNSWNIDHCHHTGEVRGLLCWNCNVGIGKLNDDAQLLRRAIQWLEQSRPPGWIQQKQDPMESCVHFSHESLQNRDQHGSECQPKC